MLAVPGLSSDRVRRVATQVDVAIVDAPDHVVAALELGPGRSLCARATAVAPELVIRSVDDLRTPDCVVAWLGSIAA